MKNLPWYKLAILKVMQWTQNLFVLPVMKWVARGQFEPAPTKHPGPYVEASHDITPLVVMAAEAETKRAYEADPEAFQAELNACMEAIENSSVKGGLIAMFGHLIAQGYPPDVCMVRVCANFLQLGIYLERRAPKDRQCIKCGAVLLKLPECPHCGTAIQEQPA